MSLLTPVPGRLVFHANDGIGHHKLRLGLHYLALARLSHVQHILLLDVVVVVPPCVDLIWVLGWTRHFRLRLAIELPCPVVAMRETGIVVASMLY